MVKYCIGLYRDVPAENQDLYKAMISYLKEHSGYHLNTYKFQDTLILHIMIISKYRLVIEKRFGVAMVAVSPNQEISFIKNIRPDCEVIFEANGIGV